VVHIRIALLKKRVRYIMNGINDLNTRGQSSGGLESGYSGSSMAGSGLLAYSDQDTGLLSTRCLPVSAKGRGVGTGASQIHRECNPDAPSSRSIGDLLPNDKRGGHVSQSLGTHLQAPQVPQSDAGPLRTSVTGMQPPSITGDSGADKAIQSTNGRVSRNHMHFGPLGASHFMHTFGNYMHISGSERQGKADHTGDRHTHHKSSSSHKGS
jgi:hypothetical protein